jgi:hypothetical protein
MGDESWGRCRLFLIGMDLYRTGFLTYIILFWSNALANIFLLIYEDGGVRIANHKFSESGISDGITN